MTDAETLELDWVRAWLDMLCEARFQGWLTERERGELVLLKRRENALLGLVEFA